MTTYAYYDILNRIQNLPKEEQLKLMGDLAAIIRQQAPMGRRKRVLEYEGVGREAWKGVDVKEFINQERDSWNG